MSSGAPTTAQSPAVVDGVEQSLQVEAKKAIGGINQYWAAVGSTLSSLRERGRMVFAQACESAWYRIDDVRDSIAAKIESVCALFKEVEYDDPYDGS